MDEGRDRNEPHYRGGICRARFPAREGWLEFPEDPAEHDADHSAHQAHDVTDYALLFELIFSSFRARG